MVERKEESEKSDVVTVKKYANRRLYNTQTSVYITLDDLFDMVREGTEFVVVDAKSGEDLTRQVLAQIILEQESGKFSLLPIGFLRGIIRLYDGKMNDVVPPYLEAMMENFTQNQDKIKEYMWKKDSSPLTQLEEIGKHNMEIFQKTFSMFSPFDSMFGEKKKDRR